VPFPLSHPWPLIGVIHVPPLPGSPRHAGNWDDLLARVRGDVEAFRDGGFDALMVENFGDAPFHPDRVPPVTVASLTRVALEVATRFPRPFGINVLRNDGDAALAIAAATGARFVRVNVLVGAMVTDQGIIQGRAHELLRLRAATAPGVQIWADVGVKHASPLGALDLEVTAADTVGRALADAVIVSGVATGKPVDEADLAAIRRGAGATPVLFGSGFGPGQLDMGLRLASGAIVASHVKREGRIDRELVQELVRRRDAAWRRAEEDKC